MEMCLLPGRHLSLRCGHSRGFCGSRSSRPSCPFRFSILRCRSWGTRWWNSCRRSTRRRLSSRLSPCPRSLWTGSRSALCVVVHGGLNSWWKYLRSYPILRCKGLWSRSLAFQFLMVVAIGAVEGRGEGSCLQGLRPGQNSTALGGVVHVDIPVPRGGGLHGPGSTASSSHSPPKSKKCAVGSALGVGTGCGL